MSRYIIQNLARNSSILRLKLLCSVQPFVPGLYTFELPCHYHSSINSLNAQFAVPEGDRDYSANTHVAKSNFLVSQLSKQGRIHEARQVFDEMADRDVITWTAVITGYIKCKMVDEARRVFDRKDAKRNVVTWTALLGGYVKMNRIAEAERLFVDMPVKNVVSWNTMVDGYARNGMVGKALEVFERMPERNVVSWNTVLTALVQSGRIEEAEKLFGRMPERDVISWTAMVAGLSKNGRIDEARVLFDSMPKRNVVSWNAMITGYAHNMRLKEAFELFERMPERDLPSWNTMITGFIQNGDLDRALKLFNKMHEKNVISWTTMISGYVQDGQNEEALKFFSKMLIFAEVKPNQGTFVSVLGACSNLAGLGEGQQIHQVICKTVYQDSAFVVSALINMYSKCGELGTARKMFDDGLISQRDLISWNGMIAAYAHHGHGREAISLFREMLKLGFRPDDVTYVGLLSACSHSGFVDEGLNYFNDLVKDSSIRLREDHIACLVDLCGRAGRLNEAYNVIQQLGDKPSASVWGALLAGCNVHGNEEIGKLAAEKLLEVESENAGTYMLLSNIYASSGNWREAAEVRLKMKEKGLKKQPGCSWLEIGNRVNVFVVGDKSHSHTKLIYSLLCDLHVKMKKSEPNDDLILEGVWASSL